MHCSGKEENMQMLVYQSLEDLVLKPIEKIFVVVRERHGAYLLALQSAVIQSGISFSWGARGLKSVAPSPIYKPKPTAGGGEEAYRYMVALCRTVSCVVPTFVKM